MTQDKIRNAIRLAVILSDDVTPEDAALGQAEQPSAETGIVCEKRLIAGEDVRGNGGAQGFTRGKIFFRRVRLQGNSSDEPRVSHQPFLLFPVAKTVRRRHAGEDAERVQRDVRMGGVQVLQEQEQRLFVVGRFFRLSGSQEAAVQELIDGQNRRVTARKGFHRPFLQGGGIAGAKIFVEQLGGRQDHFYARDSRRVLYEAPAGRPAVQRDQQHTADRSRRVGRHGDAAVFFRRRQKQRAEKHRSDDENGRKPSGEMHVRASFLFLIKNACRCSFYHILYSRMKKGVYSTGEERGYESGSDAGARSVGDD